MTLFTIILYAHIIGGFTALVAGLVAILTTKGGKAHKRAGQTYFWGMTLTCAAAVYLSVAHYNPFLFMVAFFSYQLVASGYRVLSIKNATKVQLKPKAIDWFIGGIPLAINAVFVGWGIFMATKGETFGIIGLVFGLLGMANSYGFMARFGKNYQRQRHWKLAHLQGMGGAYIATTTAFIVVNVNFLPPLLVWLLPTVIGGTIMTVVSRKIKKQTQLPNPTI